jgi:hypothetical protein
VKLPTTVQETLTCTVISKQPQFVFYLQMLLYGWSGVVLLASLQACFIYVALALLQQRRQQFSNTQKQTALSILTSMSSSAAAVCKACSVQFKPKSTWYKPAAAANASKGAAVQCEVTPSTPQQLRAVTTLCSSNKPSPATLPGPTPEQLAHLIRTRRSIYPKHMTGETVSKEAISAMLEAANWAPTHGKTEPWRFVVLGRQGMQAMQDVTEAVYQQLLAGQPEMLQVSRSSLVILFIMQGNIATSWLRCTCK